MNWRFWIPPVPLAAGLAFQIVAWALVLVDASAPSFALRLAWIHAVALGWLTLTALAVLLHVIPAFTDLRWRGEPIARAAVIVALAGIVGLVAGFALRSAPMLEASAPVVTISILAYTAVATFTLSAHPQEEDRTSAAIARALRITLGALVATALLGAILAGAYVSANGVLLTLAPSHAVLGIVGWLSVLVTGVSARTFRPMLGARPRWTVVHVVWGSGLAVGAWIAAATLPWSAALARAGILIAVAAAAVYAVDAVDALLRANTPHLAARAFVWASVAWLVLGALGAAAAVFGVPLAPAVVVIALAGWLGQMVNAHLHHLGVRVLATLVLGEDDETRPWDLLTPWLSWSAFGAAQGAIAATALRAIGAPAGSAWLGGTLGLIAVAAMVSNAVKALARARSMRVPAMT